MADCRPVKSPADCLCYASSLPQILAGITVFQGIDAILNNKPEDKPINKMLHLATSFISSVVKSSIKDDEAKRGVTITAIMIDLAIDFFCKK